jgi:hypothetical protein
MEILAPITQTLIVLTVAVNFVVLLISNFRKERENKKLRDELANAREFAQRRLIEKDIELIEKANSEVCILGINALGPLHQGREFLIRLLAKGGRVRVLLLKPKTPAFDRRVEFEEDNSSRLLAEFEASAAICRDILNQTRTAGTFEVNVHEQQPTEALVLVDPLSPDGKANKNPYPQEKGRRGLEGKHLHIPSRQRFEQEFLSWLNRYNELWLSSQRLPLAR